MAEDVEKYLANKFKKKLEMSSKYCFHSQFVKLSKLVEEILESQFSKVRSVSPELGKRSLNHELLLLDNALEECRTLSRKKALFSPDKLITQWRSLEKIRQDLEGMKASMDELDKTACPMREGRPEVSRDITTRGVDPSKVHGLEEEVMSIERLLLDPERADSFKAIGIVGMRGVGKTTLAQMIFDKAEVKDKFFPRIWVCVTPQPDEAGESWNATVAKRILTHLGVSKAMISSISSSDRGLSKLLYALHLQLAGKRYLIVLDDACGTDPWYEMLSSSFKFEDSPDDWDKRLAYGLPKGSGGAVIFTTRSEEVGNLMIGRDNLHFLQPFSDPEICWKIFTDEVKNRIEDIGEVAQVDKLKPELTKKCDGLPLAARLMGQFFVEKLNPIQSHLGSG